MILPAHVLQALSGKTAFINTAFVERETETAKQKAIKQLQAQHAPKVTAQSVIDSPDYEFLADTYTGGETIFTILE